MTRRLDPNRPIVVPFTLIIDTREQHPFEFEGMRADSKQNRRPLVVPTRVETLQTGDYTIEGFADQVTVERKSLDDAFGTFGGGRERFERELERMQEMQLAAVVIEADWPAILQADRTPSKLGRTFTPKHFFRSVLAWQQAFPKVHWWTCHSRRFAEVTTFRILQHWWERRRREAKEAAQASV